MKIWSFSFKKAHTLHLRKMWSSGIQCLSASVSLPLPKLAVTTAGTHSGSIIIKVETSKNTNSEEKCLLFLFLRCYQSLLPNILNSKVQVYRV